VMEGVRIRRERMGDEAGIDRVNREAFGQPTEARIVDAIRRGGHAAISLVAVEDATIVGHILFTPVTVEPSEPIGLAPEHPPGPASEPAADRLRILGLGPMAVLPARQRRGIGSGLVAAGLDDCSAEGAQAIVVVGHPEFYPRFGFRPAVSYDLRSEFPVPDDVFMALELTPGALRGHHGCVRYLPDFAGA